MKIKHYFAVLAAIVFSALQAQDCDFYYPQTIGAELVYQHYDKKENPTGKTKQEVLRYVNTAGGAEATIRVEILDDKEESVSVSELEVRCEAGVFYFDMESYLNEQMMEAYKEMEIKVDAGELAMPASLEAGQSLDDGTLTMEVYNAGVKFMTIEVEVTDRKVEGMEELTTPAGTFSCYKVSQTVTVRMGLKVTTSSIDWLSPGIGLIRSESYKSNDKLTGLTELVSITN